jgi:hypothetical protein
MKFAFGFDNGVRIGILENRNISFTSSHFANRKVSDLYGLPNNKLLCLLADTYDYHIINLTNNTDYVLTRGFNNQCMKCVEHLYEN